MLVSTLFTAVALALQVHAAPVNILVERGSLHSKPAKPPAKNLDSSKITPSQIANYKPFAAYASVAYCPPAAILKWSCPGCKINSQFKPIASGGNGITVQFWYVGYDSSLKTIVVAHQGTDPTKIIPLLTDAKVLHKQLDPKLFPGLSSSIHAHRGFVDVHAKTATLVLAAVKKGMAQYKTKSVTLTGHSLGASLSTIEMVYLSLQLPKDTNFRAVVFSSPRTGNQAFADYVDSHLRDLVRMNNRHDLVTIIPGRTLGYVHAGTEYHIGADGSWQVCPGQDTTARGCSNAMIPNLQSGNIADHGGPFSGVKMGQGC